MFIDCEPLRIISKTRLILNPFDRSLRAIFGAIHTNQKFCVLATIALLLEPQ